MTNDIRGTLECARLVLKTDLDELKGSNDDGLGRTSSGTGHDGQHLGIGPLSVLGKVCSPPSCLLIDIHIIILMLSGHTICTDCWSATYKNLATRRLTLDSSLGCFQHERGNDTPI